MTIKAPEDPVGPIAKKKRDLLVARIGAAVNNFAVIELQLLLLFAKCVDLPVDVAARMLAPIKNFSVMLGVIDAIARHKLEPLKALQYWLSLREYIVELSGDRNYLAHTAIAFHTPGPPDKTPDEDWEPKVGPAITDHLLYDTRKIPIDSNEALELILDFHEAAQLVSDLHLALGQPLPEKLAQPISRRRPPRSTRQVASQPKGPRRPPSFRPSRDKKRERGMK